MFDKCKIGTKFANFKKHLKITEFIVALTNSSDCVVNKQMVKLNSFCFDFRNSLLPYNII